MQQSDYEIVGKFGFESRTHRLKVLDSFRIKDFFYAFPVSGTPWQQL